MEEKKLIKCDPEVMMGKPVIDDTRITVERILELVAAGQSVGQILEAYPHLTRDGVVSAVNFAIELVQNDWKKQVSVP